MNNNNDTNKADNRTEKRKTGDIGEEVACKFLMKQGFSVIDRNYLRKYGEIDIVAKRQGITHFVEVKTVVRDVTHETKGDYKPEDNLHPWKLKRLSRVIQAYILDKKVGDNWQFDVITVVLHMKTRMASVSFMENIII